MCRIQNFVLFNNIQNSEPVAFSCRFVSFQLPLSARLLGYHNIRTRYHCPFMKRIHMAHAYDMCVRGTNTHTFNILAFASIILIDSALVMVSKPIFQIEIINSIVFCIDLKENCNGCDSKRTN